MSAVGRVATWVAVAALGLNAVLLGVAGLTAGRPLLVLGAGVAALLAGLVVLAWRRHLRTIDAMRDDRRALRDEVNALRDLVRRKD